MIADAGWIPIVLFRWLHVISACAVAGATFFLALILPARMSGPDATATEAVYSRTRRVFKMLAHTTILLLVASGTYNAIGNWSAYRANMPLTHGLLGPHLLLAAIIFTILLVVLARREPWRRERMWLRLTAALLFLTVLVASGLKYAREHPREAGPHPSSNELQSSRQVSFAVN